MDEKIELLIEIINELLDKYEASENMVIDERSGDAIVARVRLQGELMTYRERIGSIIND